MENLTRIENVLNALRECAIWVGIQQIRLPLTNSRARENEPPIANASRAREPGQERFQLVDCALELFSRSFESGETNARQ